MKNLFLEIKNLYNIFKEKFETHILTIFLVTMTIVFICSIGTTWFLPSYYTVEVEELIEKQDRLIDKQSRELIFVTNELKLQIAYTERLKLVLDLNSVDYKRYSDFITEDILSNDELMDEDYLYENELDIDTLLIKAKIRGDTFYGTETDD